MRAIAVTLSAVILSAMGISRAAAAYPDRVVTIVIPYGPGGGTDVIGRAISQRLSQKWGQPVVIDNREGAGSSIGTEFVARATPDGYTLLFSDSSSFVINPFLYDHLRYDPLRDFEFVSLSARAEPVLSISNSLPVNSVGEFIAYAKAHPGDLAYASFGVGTSAHIAMEYLKHEAGIDMVHVPFRSGTAAINDLLAGRVVSFIATYGAVGAYAADGKLKIIAAATQKRLPSHPDLPAISETLPNYSISTWFGFVAPAGTPAAIADKIHDDVEAIVHEPDFVEKFMKPQSYDAGNVSRAAFKDEMKADYVKWGELVKSSGAQIK